MSKVSADMLLQQILWESENRKAEAEKPTGIIVLLIVLNKRGPLLATHLKFIPIPSLYYYTILFITEYSMVLDKL